MVVADKISEEKENDKLTKVETEALDALINGLAKKGFLEATCKDEYKIIGTVGTAEIKTRIKEENDFLSEYKRFRNIVFIYINLYNKFSEDAGSILVSDYMNFDIEPVIAATKQYIKNVVLSENTIIESDQVREYCSKIYEDLSNNTGNYTREQLDDNIKNLRIANNQILTNFILLVNAVVEFRYKELFIFEEMSLRGLYELGIEYSPVSKEIMRRDTRIRNLLIKSRIQKEADTGDKYALSRQLLIVENPPEEISVDIM